MSYFQVVEDGYVIGIGKGSGTPKITEAEYNEILSIIRNRPQAEGKGYRLKTDLTWEEYDLPPEPEPSDEDEITNEEALDILLGGAS